jgi:hypothetical protein
MPVTVNINGLSCVHQTSGGTAVATLPDVCKTPPNAAPIPYPNIALAADLVGGTATITVDGSPPRFKVRCSPRARAMNPAPGVAW